MSQEKDRILEDAHGGDPVALARALVATPSVNPVIEESGTGEAAVAELTAGWLRAWGLSVETSEVAAGRWNVVGRLEGDDVGPTLLLNGHLDTVGVAGSATAFPAAGHTRIISCIRSTKPSCFFLYH